jgi:radical SAM protein with 4Fe4S-binding SPASM domain
MADLLRTVAKTAPDSAYAEPRPHMLPESIVSGKIKMDESTRHGLSGVSLLCCEAEAVRQDPDGSYRLDPEGPLPLVTEISYRWVSNSHLWIGVREGVVIVLTDHEHKLFLMLRDGLSSAAVTARASLSDPQAGDAVNALIGRLAAAGFIRGIEGWTDRWEPDPSRFMRIHLTRLCNLACKHCYADSSPFVSTAGQMSVERWLKVIEDFAAAGGEKVLFTGGEALAYAGCEDLMRRSKELGLDVTLFSNGLLIARHLDALRNYVDQVQISIDGPDAKTNDPIRGVGTFERARAAVELLLEAKVSVRVSMVVMEENIESVRQHFLPFARDWTRRGVEWRLGYGLARHGRGEDLGDTYEIQDVRPVVDALLEELEGGGGPIIARRTHGCGYAEQIVVAPDGSIHPCHLLDGSITHVESQPMADLIKLLKRTSDDYSVDNTEGCNRCDIRHLCGGGCRVQNGKTTGNRRVANCTAADKLHRLENLVGVFAGALTE